MEEFKAVALDLIRKYAVYALLVGVVVGVMVARGQANNIN